jgi:potassium efflux system protein
LVLLASPVPLALYVIGVALREVEGSTFLFAAAAALPFVASIAALLESTRQFLAPAGLAEGHFGWPHEVTRLIHRGLLWREIVFLPLIYVAVHLGMAGMKLSSPEQLQAHNNSLGRVCFIAALVILGFSLLSLFRPRRRGQRRQLDENVAWLHRLSMYAYPVVVLSTIVPAALAVLGYYMTGFLLAYQMLRTAWVVVAVLLLGGLLVRWREVRHRAAADEAEQEGDAPLPESERQVRRLFRFVVVLVAAIGFYSVWAEAVPALQILDRIQIWPRIELIESTDDGSMPAATRVAAPEERQTESESGEPSTTPRIPTPMDPGAGQTGATPSDGSPLTLWHLIEAILAILITVVLVKNIPGLLELILKRRTRLDSGARIALGTLIRYAIIIVGVTAAFTLLGISWSKIQWLAAALTFGLGFGLQEIVANFVSGLILLMERPVRVGDAVTVGNLQGRVSRIQIRATTITLWDRSEMVVPNKEFITTKLINWTLTDSRRRIDIPVRVAYGADLQLVKDTLVEVAQKHPLAFDEPSPQALLLDFGDDAIKFELRRFVDFGTGLQVRDELHMQIDKAFRERGIEFPLPQLNLHLPTRRGERVISRETPESPDEPE